MKTTKMLSFGRFALAGVLAAALVACGGGGGDAGTTKYPPLADSTGNGGGTGTGTGGTSTNTNGGTSTTTNNQAVALTVRLLDGANQPSTALVGSNTLRVTVKLEKNKVPLADQLVQFNIDQQGDYGSLDQLTGLTDAQGVAAVTLAGGASSGAGRVKVTAKLDDGSTVEAGANFVSSATATQTTNLTLSSFSTGSTQVSAYGTTGFSVQVLNNGAAYGVPVTVSFASDCAPGKATITTSATTGPGGIAVGTFQDNGCATSSSRPVVLTASISTNSAQRQVTVLPSTVGSFRFVSVSPSDASITLKGQGGNGRQENAQLIFRLVDQAGNGVASTDVCFDSTTYVGGLTLDGFNNAQPANLPTNQGGAALCGNDVISQIKYVKRTDANGNVAVQIASGSVPTPVRVRARAIYPAGASSALETFSDSLSISTGLPLQRSFDLSADKTNIDGGNGTAGGTFSGDEATLTVRLADQFSNPVPDGTKVNFVASGGAVCTAQNGSCTTVNGSCSCKFVGTNRRPKDGRVVVLAYTDGLEDYIDANGNNVFDAGVETFTDLADAFVDANKSGAYSGVSVNEDTDAPIPFQSPTPSYINGNGSRGNAHIRASTIVYMSTPTGVGDPTAVIPNSSLSESVDLLTNVTSPRFIRINALNGCPSPIPVPQVSVGVILDDGYGNPLAAGTTVSPGAFTSNLALQSVKPSTVLAFGARPPSPLIDGPLNGVGSGGNVIKTVPWTTTAARGNVVTGHVIALAGINDKCSGNARFVTDVTSPKGAAQTLRVLYEGEPRTTNRFFFDVQYRDILQFARVGSGSVNVGGTVAIGLATVNPLAGATVSSYSLDWGDGSPVVSGTSLPITNTTHQYTAAANRTVTLTVIDSEGQTYQESFDVTVQ